MARWLAALTLLFSFGTLATPSAARAQNASGGPSCLATDPGVAVPNAPHGLYVSNVNDVQDPAQQALIQRYLPSDPTLCGADLMIPWSAVDRGPGRHPRYDWSYVDGIMRPWVAAGKSVNFIVWGVAELVRQQLGQPVTPAYVLQRVHTIQCSPLFPATPVYWEAGYQDNYRAFMRALLAHYDHDPHLGYVRFGIGAGAEDYPANKLRGACRQRWQAYGLSEQRWQEYSLSTIRYEAGLHSSKELMVGLNGFPGDRRAQLPVVVATAAVEHGLGFGIQGLATGAIRARQQGQPCYADWCALFERFAGRVPLEVQTYTQSNPNGQGPTGPLPPLLRFALREHAQIFELYPQEWLLADDPSYPGYAQYHQEYENALRATARMVSTDPRVAPAVAPSESIQVERAIPYLQTADPEHTGDLYLPPAGGSSRPAVVVVHGGGWSGGSDQDPDTIFLSHGLAQQGDVVFNINYRLAKQGPAFPQDVQDVKDAIAFLGSQAQRWQINPDEIAVVGTSAGGHLALMAAYTPNSGLFAPPHYRGSTVHVAAVGSFFGPTDLTAFPASAPARSTQIVAHYLGATYDHNPALYHEASPISYLSTAVPTIMEHGTADGVVPYSQATELDQDLARAGVAHQLVTVPGGRHGLMLGVPGTQRDQELAKLVTFLAAAYHPQN